jgi:hypothetical protein
MSHSALDAYRQLMNELLIVRETECGSLPVEVESAYVERLDDLWWRLSEQEQTGYEAELASAAAPTGPEQLDLVDCDVQEGSRSTPRRAA